MTVADIETFTVGDGSPDVNISGTVTVTGTIDDVIFTGGTATFGTTTYCQLNGGTITAGSITNTTITGASQGDDIMAGFATAGSITTFKFDAVYGHETITNFTAADKIVLPTSEFSSLSSMLTSHANASNGDVVITAADGDTLTIDGTTIAALSKLTNSFSFV